MKKIIALFIALVVLISFAACEKKQIIGYEPEIPQQWIDEEEREKNNPNTEIVRTTDFDGIWQNEMNGKYYHFYNGHVFELDKLNAGPEEYSLLGTVVVLQTVDKEFAKRYNEGLENELLSDDVFAIRYNSSFTTTTDATTSFINEERTKTVTDNGKEYIFRFVGDVDGWPEGFSF